MGQKRSAPSTPPVQPARKMSNQMLQFRQKMIPIKPSGVKFPVVTHKEIQVEIIPSEDAKLRNNIDKYEIEFKGRKTPNKYNVKPNIKIVKLIGLQSDTEYLIKVFAIRNNGKSFRISIKDQSVLINCFEALVVTDKLSILRI